MLFSPLFLKSKPDWPTISVSTSQQFRVGEIVWFGCLSAISQLASRAGKGSILFDRFALKQIMTIISILLFQALSPWRGGGEGIGVGMLVGDSHPKFAH